MTSPNYKDSPELLKAGVTIEAQEQIMALRLSAFTIQEENLELRNHILAFEVRVRELKRLEGEPCPAAPKESLDRGKQ